MTNKLQLYIAISHNGFKEMIDINADESVKAEVCDLSPAVALIDYDAKLKNIIYMLRYVRGGVFVVLIRTIPSSKPHHLAAWVFIPSHISVSGPEIEDVMDALVQAVSNPKITADIMNGLRRVFAKDYAVVSDPGQHVANFGTEYAHRYYGELSGYTLSDLIGKQRYQVSYLPFAGVILADKEAVGIIKGTDLSDEPLEQVVKLLPPQGNGSEYEPMIFGCRFDAPFLVPLMGTVEILWKSPLRPELKQSVMVNRPNMRIECIAPAPLVAPAPAAPAPAAPVPAAPVPAASALAAPASVPAASALAAPASVPAAPASADPAPIAPTPAFSDHAENAHSDANTMATASTTSAQAVPVPADAASRDDDSKMEGKSASKPMERVSDVASDKAMPVASTPNSGTREIEEEGPKSFWSERAGKFLDTSQRSLALKCGIIGFLCGVVLTLFCQWLVSSADRRDVSAQVAEAMSQQQAAEPEAMADIDITAAVADVADDKEEVKKETKQEGKKEKVEPQPPTLQDAIEYLDSYTTWSKEKLESFPALKGLYDDMNSFNTKRIVSYWGPKLKKSKRFGKVVYHSRESIKRKKKPRVPEGQKLFNPNGTSPIKVQRFLNTINP